MPGLWIPVPRRSFRWAMGDEDALLSNYADGFEDKKALKTMRLLDGGVRIKGLTDGWLTRLTRLIRVTSSRAT